MQRILLGAAGIAFTAVGTWLAFDPASDAQGFDGVLVKGGLVLCAIALAFPQLVRFFAAWPPWYLACIVTSLMFVIIRPRLAPFIVPVLVVLWFLGPRSKSKSRPPPRRQKAPSKSRAR